MTDDPVRPIADAVLYEGYILWPYRRSALKNQRRFTFGGIYPPAHAERHPDDPAMMQTEVLVQAGAQSRFELTIRFLQVVQRQVARRVDDRLEPVAELVVGDERLLTWEEAVEREVRIDATLPELRAGIEQQIAVGAGVEHEELPRGAGALRRSWRELAGCARARTTVLGPQLRRLTVQVLNMTAFDPAQGRQRALSQAFCSTHTVARVRGGGFVSLADPPLELAEAAASCRNIGTWPVPVGHPGDRSTILSSPIILEDYPRVAPESPGDLFDGGEIDQLLVLNILAMTDEEKQEMAASDPRAREILERTERLTPEQLMALHGTIREFGMQRSG